MTLVQAVVGALPDGALYGVLAAGLGLVFSVTGRLHFAMAATFVLTVYVAGDLVERGLPTLPSIVVGVGAGVALGLVVELLVYAPIVRRGPDVALLSVFVAAIGIVTAVENLIRLVWPEVDSRQLPAPLTPRRLELPGGVGLTNVELFLLLVALAFVVGLDLVLRRTVFGQQVRATQGNPRLAVLIGISERRVRLWVFAIGSLLFSVVAVLTAVRSSVTPSGGLGPTFLAVVVVFLAGVGSSPLRYLVAGVAVGVAEALAAVYISSAWSSIVVFGVLFGYIALTPSLESWRIRRARLRPMPPVGEGVPA